MESSRPKEKRNTKEHITPRNGNRHEKDEQELDGTRKEGPGQSGLENAGRRPMLHWDSISKPRSASDIQVSFAIVEEPLFSEVIIPHSQTKLILLNHLVILSSSNQNIKSNICGWFSGD
ncbi:unnamed protein product [Schistosoma margrebowiei]|uniref:Uncharacterized protein n=1 Tax=Schistosoma margrebowiei TaxID=48269 RepID=A0A183LVP8_9TREM|nr:unnamed protein product [Schistosoma margrebowiei]